MPASAPAAEMTSASPATTTGTPGEPIVIPAKRKAEAGNAGLLSSGEYADFEIVCGEGDKEKKWKLHRSIVCTQSITIKDLVDGKMDTNEVGSTTIKKEPVVKVENEETSQAKAAGETKPVDTSPYPTIRLYDPPENIYRLLRFIYASNYNDNRNIAPSYATRSTSAQTQSLTKTSSALIINTRMLILGYQYRIENLQRLAASKFESALPSEGLTTSFVSALKLLYQNDFPNRSLILKPAVVFAASKYHSLLRLPEFQAFLVQKGQVGLDILTTIARAEEEKTYKDTCPECGMGNKVASLPTHLQRPPGKRIFNHYCFKCVKRF